MNQNAGEAKELIAQMRRQERSALLRYAAAGIAALALMTLFPNTLLEISAEFTQWTTTQTQSLSKFDSHSIRIWTVIAGVCAAAVFLYRELGKPDGE